MSKTHFIKSYGCQMNAFDAARMADVLEAEGYAPASDEAAADLVVLNTCHIRERATDKVFSELGRLRQVRANNIAAGRDTMIAVAGCVAQAEGEEILRRAPHVDMVFGPQTYHRLPEFIAKVHEKRGKAEGGGVLDTEFPAITKFGSLPTQRRVQTSMFLTIQEGCDKFCTFCVVPYTRGAEFSRPAGEVLAEAQRLVAEGAREIVLLGQNVNAWHGAAEGGGELTFAALLREMAERLPGTRLRYTTSHPLEMDADLIRAHGEIEQLMPFLHLPVQSGSDRILAMMNRRHKADDYRRIIDALRAVRPDIAFSTDFIIGFPGETDSDFEATMQLARDVGFAMAYSFRYSARPGTPAAEMEGQIDEAEGSRRLGILQALLAEQQRDFNLTKRGQVVDVLLEREGRHPGQLAGRSPWNQAVAVDGVGHDLLGTVQPVIIEEIMAFSMKGRMAGSRTGTSGVEAA